MRDIEDYQRQYTGEDFEAKVHVPYRRRMILETVERYHPKRFLEIGCGNDSLANYVKDFEQYTIVEPGRNFLEKAEQELRHKQVRYIHGFMEDSVGEVQKEEYDIIICSGLLHEVEHPQTLLSAVHQVCTKGCIVHINVPNAKSFHRLLARESGLISDEYEKSERNITLQQSSVFDKESLHVMIEKSCIAGKTIEFLSEGSYFIKPFTSSQMDRILEEGLVPQDVTEGLWKMSKYLPEHGAELYVNYRMKEKGTE